MAKILILSSYFNRPILVRNALASIRKADQFHQDWELMLLDDNSPHPVRDIVKEEMKDYLPRISVANSGMSFDDKINKGLILGEYINFAIRQSNADIAITLTDDDELFPTYLRDISGFFEQYPDVMYCYSKISLFNPNKERSLCLTGKYNVHEGPINPVNKVDGSQVAWRTACSKEHNVWLPQSTLFVQDMPWAKDTDKGWFERLYEKFGPAMPTGFVSQYKSIHDWQLLWHKKTDADGLKEYYNHIVRQGGIDF